MAGYSRFGFICYHYIVSNLAADFVVTICMVHNSGYILSEIEMDFQPDRMIGSLMIKLRGAE